MSYLFVPFYGLYDIESAMFEMSRDDWMHATPGPRNHSAQMDPADGRGQNYGGNMSAFFSHFQQGQGERPNAVMDPPQHPPKPFPPPINSFHYPHPPPLVNMMVQPQYGAPPRSMFAPSSNYSGYNRGMPQPYAYDLSSFPRVPPVHQPSFGYNMAGPHGRIMVKPRPSEVQMRERYIEKHDIWIVECNNGRKRVAALVDDVNQLEEAKTQLERDFQGWNGEGNPPVSEISLPYLEKQSIKHLSCPSPMFSWAVYYCSICDYHLKDCLHVVEHLPSHFREQKRIEERQRLEERLPVMSESQERALDNEMMTRVINRLDYEGRDKKKEIAARVIEELHDLCVLCQTEKDSSAIHIDLFGSLVSGCVHSQSDININVCIDREKVTVFIQLYELLKTNENWRNVRLTDSTAQCTIEAEFEGVAVTVDWNNGDCVKLSKLIALYNDLDERLQLVRAVVHGWAQQCDLTDKKKLGSLHAVPLILLDIMLIHALQQTHFLPCINEVRKASGKSFLDEDINDLWEEREERKESLQLGRAFLAFLQYYAQGNAKQYVIQITSMERVDKSESKYNKKHVIVLDAIRDRPLCTLHKMFQCYFLNCFLSSFIFFRVPRRKNGQQLMNIKLFQSATQSPYKKKTKEKEEIEGTDGGQVVNSCEEVKEMKEVTETVEGRTVSKEETKEEAKEKKTISVATAKLIDLTSSSEEKETFEDVELDGDKVYSRKTMLSLRESNILPQEIWDVCYYLRLATSQVTEGDDSSTLISEESKTVSNSSKKKRERRKKKKTMEKQSSTEEEKDVDFPSNATQAECCNSVCTVSNDHTEEVEYGEDASGEKRRMEAMENLIANWNMGVKNIKEEKSEEGEKKEENEGIEDFVVPDRTMEESKMEQLQPTYEELNVHIQECNINSLSEEVSRMGEDDFSFEGSNWGLTAGFRCDMHCNVCDSSKHATDNCPQLTIPPILPYNRKLWKEHYASEFDGAIMKLYDNEKLTLTRKNQLDKVKKSLHICLSGTFNVPFKLDLFGSSSNGFGTRSSDVDVCFRFASKDGEEEERRIFNMVNQRTKMQVVEHPSFESYIIHKIADSILMGFSYVQPITSAKVPIVKFSVPGMDPPLEGDISYYNELAMHNTNMLSQYCSWMKDDRLSVLGIFVKHWAKSCDIGDASKGSLSSYAYIIMLIHFLQRTEPPLLPFLQERGEVEERMVDGANVYFYDGPPDEDWLSRDTRSLSELFIGFVDYLVHFDWKNEVMQIRQERRLTKMEKGWKRQLCIEDPFDLDHNLGSGVSARMYAFILKSFINSREQLYTLKERRQLCIRRRYDENSELAERELLNYAKLILTGCRAPGGVPQDRTCFRCGKYGHYADVCPNMSRAKSNGGRRGAAQGRRNNDRNGAKKEKKDKNGGVEKREEKKETVEGKGKEKEEMERKGTVGKEEGKKGKVYSIFAKLVSTFSST